jgi:hypothetical protein
MLDLDDTFYFNLSNGILALVVSITAIGFCVTMRKKINVSAGVNNTAKNKKDE